MEGVKVLPSVGVMGEGLVVIDVPVLALADVLSERFHPHVTGTDRHLLLPVRLEEDPLADYVA